MLRNENVRLAAAATHQILSSLTGNEHRQKIVQEMPIQKLPGDASAAALSIDTPVAVITAFEHKGLIVEREGHWRLTPVGIAQTS